MIEKEVKVLLNREEFGKIENEFNWQEIKRQTNYYYRDDDDILKNNKITIRVREVDQKNYLQIKTPIYEENALHIKKEYEKELDCRPEKILSDDIYKLCGIMLPDVNCIGYLYTERKIYDWNSMTEICLDKNEYFGVIDYELEIEYENEIEEKLLDQFKRLFINFDKKSEGKYARFLNVLNKS